MSPRSAEFLDGAKRRLAGARGALDQDPGTALSAAYYAMLYAARAALSERDRYAKSHAGTWHLFRVEFVEPRLFQEDLVSQAQEVQKEREDADYAAWAAPKAEAERAINVAAGFLAAVETLISQIES